MLDHLAPPRRHYYGKALYLSEFSDLAIETAIANFANVSSPLSLVVIQYKGGEMARGAPDRTAFGNRAARHLFVIFSGWEDAAESDQHLKWSRRFGDQMAPFGAGGEYVNELGLEEEEGSTRIQEAFGENYDRLVEIKTKYDPTNLFRHNQNIRPSM
jgi:FAD/FMN-containing dehydrogenase